MSILTMLRRVYAGFWKKRYEKNWDQDFKVLLKKHEDPFNLEGLELALLHLSKVPIKEPPATLRRRLTLYAGTASVEHLLATLAQARLYVGQRDSMPQNFLPSSEVRQIAFDDYFVSVEGHAVSIEKIRPSVEGRVLQLIAIMRELEVDEETQYGYYSRKFRPLYRDAFYVLQAIHETSFR